MNDICFIVQARIGSTRLPNKMMMPFHHSKGVFELVLNKLKNNFPQIKVIVATSVNSENDILETIANANDCSVYRGSEKDVLKRFIDASAFYKYKKIIRICADNPFLDIEEMNKIINFLNTNETFDYLSFRVNNTPSIKTHFGFWVEFVTSKALSKVFSMTNEPFYHEHVTNFIYENPTHFNIHFLETNEILEGRNDIRMTVDTEKDFEMLAFIYQTLTQRHQTQFGINEIVKFLDENEDLKSSMTKQIELNSK